MSGRAVPFHCPYCGDEDLRPHQPEDTAGDAAASSSHGQWECRSCLRAFKLSMIGQLRRPTTTPTTRTEASR
jgi:transposase-like protein